MYILPLTTTLVFYMMAGLAMACILVLQALTGNARIKGGYVLLALTFVFWAWRLSLPHGEPGSWWLYALPILWLVLLFRFGFPTTRERNFSLLPGGEPRYTQESLAGRPATREALTFYFLLLLISLIIGLVFFAMALGGWR